MPCCLLTCCDVDALMLYQMNCYCYHVSLTRTTDTTIRNSQSYMSILWTITWCWCMHVLCMHKLITHAHVVYFGRGCGCTHMIIYHEYTPTGGRAIFSSRMCTAQRRKSRATPCSFVCLVARLMSGERCHISLSSRYRRCDHRHPLRRWNGAVVFSSA